ncbi:MAG TPA: diacylglycerol kinase family protein [Longimicrobiales bacterium]
MVREPKQGAAGAYADRTLIILNPAAGQKQNARLRRSIGGAFAARCAPFDLAETQYAGHATVLARDAVRRGYRAVCVVGGDGTLAEAATALAGTAVPLALIPRGTANQVAHNLRIPTALEAAVDTALEGTPTSVDLGRIDGRAFALVAGAGFDAAVMAAATRSLKERWGFAAYIFAAVKESLGATPADFHVVADGEELHVRAIAVMLANMGELFAHFLPFRLPLAPQPTRSWQDGLLDVVIVAPRNLTEFPSILWRAATRRFGGDSRLIHLQAREVAIHADPPIAVQIDGDAAGQTPVAASAVPAGVQILTPAPLRPS